MPVFDRELGGDDNGVLLVAAFEDIEEGELDMDIQGLKAKIIQDEEWYFSKGCKKFFIGALEFSGSDQFDKAAHGIKEGFKPVDAGLSPEGAGEIGLTASGSAGDENVLGVVDKGSLTE